MRLTDCLGRELLFFDGAMGTQLHRAGLPADQSPDMANLLMPEVVRAIHRAYLDAGCSLLKTNTFVTNALRLRDSGHTVAEVVQRAVDIARGAIADAGGEARRFVLLDMGPTGRLLAPLGDLDFDEALAAYAEVVAAGVRAGVDGILIETMSDAYELKAAVLAAKDSGLPVLATVTVDEAGKLLTGADMRTVAALLEGLRVDALGLNCGFGAQALLPHVRALRGFCGLPLILNANAGLPRVEGGETVFSQTPEQFAEAAAEAFAAGVSVLGGCCGTTPAHIAAMTARLAGCVPEAPQAVADTVIASGSRAVVIDGRAPVLIGERINPTGKPAMKRALAEGNYAHMQREAVRQQEAGVHALDVNAGLPGIDEAAALRALVDAVQEVSDLPLQLDTADPRALEAAMRRCNGKPMINSVSGKAESMAAVFPLAQRYGGVIVALTLDEKGIPETAQGRVDVARRIIEMAEGYGIARRDIVVDPLAMAVSAQPDAGLVALEALRRIRAELGVQTILGVSNISFGLPQRGAMNSAFFAMAAGAGLSAAIVNPFDGQMRRAFAATRALLGEDSGCAGYIDAMQREALEPKADAPGGEAHTLASAVRLGLRDAARQCAGERLAQATPMEIIEGELIPALNEVGAAFEAGRAFLPQLLRGAEAAKAAFEVLRGAMQAGAEGEGRGTVVIATVYGDIHDIGKNIARAMLENYQFDVVDLGRNVPAQKVVDAVRAHGARLVGLSALMTTTVGEMEKTIRLLREAVPDCRIMVGGAVLTPEYAARIGADRHVRDAMDSVRYAQAVLGA